MPYLKLADHDLHYRIDGDATEKPWLVFCNSLGTDLTMWDEQAEALADDYRILRYDRRGHGRSTTPPPPYALHELGADVLALLDALGIDRVHFCGLSIGGLVGQWLGINASRRLDKIIVCATASKIGTAESWMARIDAVRANGLASLADATRDRWFSPSFNAREPGRVANILDSFAASDVDGYVGCCAALASGDLNDRIRHIANPLLAVSGIDDPVCPPADLMAIAGSVANGRHISLPGRHLLNVESATSFNTAIARFLATGGQTAGSCSTTADTR
ncbi:MULTISPECIES: 3-oxoadipate enol-lactonase [unclassified Rhizobium]|uniref:3-oxoadipate enol-lactonase n=1 Tax=unclassified Rhizobium TaxID=2613769 RepID=UPI001ADABE49|nr:MULTISPECIES: 3-oxoadipate enol-lactonase [unclassified Rhizobium]MBO9123710.1 3-oxoadipate enol-lactonase [Rhizobium sp. 16-488-2b]MBO9174242.1 3-oxoadipate enol-lactonase [Rhizobium sp. 16-488-2a]